MPRAKNLVGNRYGRLLVVSQYREGIRTYLNCKCDCGAETSPRSDGVTAGKVVSCGCHQKEEAGKINRKHGKYLHPLYSKWQEIKSRCYMKSHKAYMRYGGRGIFVCDEWKNNPEAFIEWGTRNGWEHPLEIDRIDNDKGYSPDNCRFVTHKENMRNTSRCMKLRLNGATMSLKEVSLAYRLPYSMLRQRIKRGWTLEQSISIPSLEKGKKLFLGKDSTAEKRIGE